MLRYGFIGSEVIRPLVQLRYSRRPIITQLVVISHHPLFVRPKPLRHLCLFVSFLNPEEDELYVQLIVFHLLVIDVDFSISSFHPSQSSTLVISRYISLYLSISWRPIALIMLSCICSKVFTSLIVFCCFPFIALGLFIIILLSLSYWPPLHHNFL